MKTKTGCGTLAWARDFCDAMLHSLWPFQYVLLLYYKNHWSKLLPSTVLVILPFYFLVQQYSMLPNTHTCTCNYERETANPCTCKQEYLRCPTVNTVQCITLFSTLSQLSYPNLEWLNRSLLPSPPLHSPTQSPSPFLALPQPFSVSSPSCRSEERWDRKSSTSPCCCPERSTGSRREASWTTDAQSFWTSPGSPHPACLGGRS